MLFHSEEIKTPFEIVCRTNFLVYAERNFVGFCLRKPSLAIVFGETASVLHFATGQSRLKPKISSRRSMTMLLKSKALQLFFAVCLLASLACSGSANVGGTQFTWGDPQPALTQEEVAEIVASEINGADVPAQQQPAAENPVVEAGPSVSHDLNSLVTITGAPDKVTPDRWANGVINENVCTLPAGQEMCGTPGVVGVSPDDTEGLMNPSAAIVSPDSQESLENLTGTKFVHEGGYQLTTTAGATQKFGPYSVTTHPQTDTEFQVWIRGMNPGPGDLNLDVDFSGYHKGATTVTQYQVKENAGGFVDQTYIQEQVDNSHFRNCGLHGCRYVYVLFFDANNGSWTLLLHADGVWSYVGGNVAQQ
jgi:hypothetical protein